jgi:ABC-type branched-subunit amino acid transport system substrate-binding protein
MKELGDKPLGIIGSGRVNEWTPGYPLSDRFKAAMKKKMGGVNEYAYSTYVAVATLLEALKSTAGDTSAETLIKAWRGVKADTPAGVISFEEDGCGIADQFIFQYAKDEGGAYYWKTIKKYPKMRQKIPGEGSK